MKILLFGATGLVGQSLLRQLLARADGPKESTQKVSAENFTEISEIVALVRESANSSSGGLFPKHPKLKWVPFDFKDWDSVRAYLNADLVFIAVGTTIKKSGLTLAV